MKKTVNLDAMIERADFKAEEGFSAANRFKQLKASDLKADSAMRYMLRKPDFQRETRDWNVAQITNFITSILERHFIPSIILWQNSGAVTFVIDGAHRLSAFMAWINDDYGDGEISNEFYDKKISDEQLDLAKKARTQIEKSIGKYSMYQDAIRNKQKYSEDILKKAMGLESFAFEIQWIEGDMSVAEKSFFNINQKAVPINPTELQILAARNKPIGIAARAITYSGTGYKYWKRFQESIQVEIENLAQDINDILFLPKTKRPITTLDVAIAGKNQMDLQLIFDVLIYSNPNISDEEDLDGKNTIEILTNTKKILQIINSKEAGSLGLHPIIYFYSKKGNFKPANFYAIILLIRELKQKGQFNEFIDIRKDFEEFIYKNDYIFEQLNRNLRSTKKSSDGIKNMFLLIIDGLKKGLSEKEILILIKEKYVNINIVNEDEIVVSDSFNTNRKSETYISTALQSVVRCSICGGVVHVNATSVDHIIRKREGGLGAVCNGQITHPYCNTGYKH
ncbi:DUF262 domain-containing protein [Hungatella hathewayi]|uniref:HNH endonuclease family protein n=1 Tax=Hungatella hathewayi TaxID=154046 RepID=UPI00033FAAA5|nr:DUF262 domain-containing protein [Hungatella hathewayi]CCZ63383.1 putative uncharacterized protein [Hungatella hathewayi CAG:224]